MLRFAKTLLPDLNWLRHYDHKNLSGDLVAGVTVAVMLVPQSMAYAMLAELPPVVGLYASTVPILAYAIWGSSRQLSVGPVAIVSLSFVTAASALAEPGTPEYLALAVVFALLVGFVQILLGILRLGVMTHFISHAVISGFTSAAAIVILLSQVRHLLGIPTESHHAVLETVAGLVRHFSELDVLTAMIGLGSLVLLFLGRRLPRCPTPLIIVIAGMLLVYLAGWENAGVRIVGKVPSGLPAFRLPQMWPASAQPLLSAALLIVFVGFIESIAIARRIATQERYHIDPNRELVALGFANVAAGFFSGFPVTGGFSRTAVNHQAGARSALASLVTAALVILTLVALTPLFHYLPQAVLAAIVIGAVVGLINIREMRNLFRLNAGDGWVLLLTFFATLVLGIAQGIVAGILLSLAQMVWRSAHPYIAEMGFIAAEETFRDLARYPDAIEHPKAVILRIDGSLYFADMAFVVDRIRRRMAERPDVEWVVLEMGGVNEMDSQAVTTLAELMSQYDEQGVHFAYVGMKAGVRDMVARADWNERHRTHTNYRTLQQALDSIAAAGTDQSSKSIGAS